MRINFILYVLTLLALSCSELYPAPDGGKTECKSGTDEFTGDWLFTGTIDGHAVEFPLSIDIACIGEHRAFIPPGCTMFHTKADGKLTGREVSCELSQSHLSALRVDGDAVEFEGTVNVHFHDGQEIVHDNGVLTMTGACDFNSADYTYSFTGNKQ